ncbi:MAG: hypothetical protein U0P45_00345 [Acidimicrobiales bacterium]
MAVAAGSIPRRAARLATAAALVLTGLVGAARPAGAQTVAKPSMLLVSPTSSKVTVLVGGMRADLTLFPVRQMVRFAVDPSSAKDHVFLYNPGSGRDGILTYWVSNGKIRTTFREEHVDGWYRPFTYGSGIFWYAPGTAPDSIWTFDANLDHTAAPEDVDGDYIPVFWHGRQCCDSVRVTRALIWYAPGTARDWMWVYDDQGGHSTRPMTINGRYRPIPGWFILDGIYETSDLLWYSQDGPEYVWSPQREPWEYASYKVGDIGPGARPVVGDYVPRDYGYPLVDTIWWYFPGDKPEAYWTEAYQKMDASPAGNVRGTYRPVRFGDHDVLMLGSGTTGELVHLTEQGPSGSFHLTGLPPAALGSPGTSTYTA